MNDLSPVFDKKGDDLDKIKKEHEKEKEVLIKKIGIKNNIDGGYYQEPSYGVRRIKNELLKLGFKMGKRLVIRRVVSFNGRTVWMW